MSDSQSEVLRKPLPRTLRGISPPVHDGLQTWPGAASARACVPGWVIVFPPSGAVPLPLHA